MSTVNVFDQKFSIDEEQKNLIEEFSFFDDWTERYEYLIDLGRKLPEFPSEYQVDEFKLCLLYTSPSPRDKTVSRMPSSA